jgi:colanic acid/amylovoran biosynthesis glycosyltransferase
MSRNLMMVTSGFPYGHGESFVRAELEYMGKSFDQVTVVPCFVSPDHPPREVAHPVELAYAQARWGKARILHVACSFVRALWRYEWVGEAMLVVRKPHRLENVKELVRSLYRARLFEQFLEWHQRQGGKLDLLYFYWVVPEIAGALAFRRFSKCPAARRLTIVARAHGGDLYEEGRRGAYAGLTRAILAGVDAVYCISAHGKSYLDGKYPHLSAKFHLARLGVDDPGFINPQPDGNILSILSCSFMVPGKRLHLIAMAIDYLLDHHPELRIRWTHIGDGDLAERLHSQVQTLFAGRSVEVDFKGYMKQPDLIAFYREAAFDVIVNVSDTEGIPVSLMEASSVGIPMVATNVGGSGEIVNSCNGLLIDENADIASIAKAILTFSEKSAARPYRRQARDYWQTHFDARQNYARFGQMLLEKMDAP